MKREGRLARWPWVQALACAVTCALLATPAVAGKGNDKGNAWGTKRGSAGSGRCSTSPTPPTISGLPEFTIIEGESYAFVPSAADANCDTLTFSISGKPAWASFDASTGGLDGTPPSGAAGTYPEIVIAVSDGTSSTALPRFSITVFANHAPVLTGTPPARVPAGQRYSFTPGVFDGDGQVLRFSVTGKPAWASFDATSGTLSGTPSDADAGSFGGISISVTDGLLSDSLGPFSITVDPGNRPPSIAGQPATSVAAGQAYQFTPSASDPDGDVLHFSVRNLPPWASFDTGSGRLAGTPPETAAGEYIDIGISVSDDTASASLPAFTIVVEATNRAPSIAGVPAGAITAGDVYRFVPVATDADGDPLRFSIANKPPWATFNAATGELSGTPGSDAVGTYADIRLSVSDGQASASLPAFSVAVEQVSTGSATLSWQPPVERTDGTPLVDLAGYRIYYGNAPDSLGRQVTLDNPGMTSYVVENLSRGTWYFAMTAFDGAGLESDHSQVGSKTIN